jgi:hypothetical protein
VPSLVMGPNPRFSLIEGLSLEGTIARLRLDEARTPWCTQEAYLTQET